MTRDSRSFLIFLNSNLLCKSHKKKKIILDSSLLLEEFQLQLKDSFFKPTKISFFFGMKSVCKLSQRREEKEENLFDMWMKPSIAKQLREKIWRLNSLEFVLSWEHSMNLNWLLLRENKAEGMCDGILALMVKN